MNLSFKLAFGLWARVTYGLFGGRQGENPIYHGRMALHQLGSRLWDGIRPLAEKGARGHLACAHLWLWVLNEPADPLLGASLLQPTAGLKNGDTDVALTFCRQINISADWRVFLVKIWHLFNDVLNFLFSGGWKSVSAPGVMLSIIKLISFILCIAQNFSFNYCKLWNNVRIFFQLHRGLWDSHGHIEIQSWSERRTGACSANVVCSRLCVAGGSMSRWEVMTLNWETTN